MTKRFELQLSSSLDFMSGKTFVGYHELCSSYTKILSMNPIALYSMLNICQQFLFKALRNESYSFHFKEEL